MLLITVIIVLLLIMFTKSFRNRRRQQTDESEMNPVSPTIPEPHENDDDETCRICLDSLISHDFLCCLSTQCNHKFHTKCLLKWFKCKGTAQCPLCRTQVKDNDLMSWPKGAQMSKVVKRRLRRFFNYSARQQDELRIRQRQNMILEEIELLNAEAEAIDSQSREIWRELDQLDQWEEEVLENDDELQREELAQRFEYVRQRFELMQQRRQEFLRRLNRLRTML